MAARGGGGESSHMERKVRGMRWGYEGCGVGGRVAGTGAGAEGGTKELACAGWDAGLHSMGRDSPDW